MERIPLPALFPARLPIIGMLHAPPLPGAPGWGGAMEAVLEHVLRDAATLAAGGVDGLLLENFGDVPFHAGTVAPETVAALAVLLRELRRDVSLPIGVNVLRNDAAAALALAAVTGARFIRVNVHTGAMLTDQGWITGHADRTLRRRAMLRAPVAIAADVLVKHAVAPAGLSAARAARDTWERGRADVLIVSGAGTGEATPADRLAEVRAAVPEAPLWIGSGLDAGSAAELLAHADGAIVGSALQRDGRAGAPVDGARVRRLMAEVSRLR
ncbi:MAG TPA: BtpA/SgcQ family protein [Longimicrobiales bacterium]|nr:BtpA/SgcQ family protein [Longimicrobiales bacterium]